MAATVVVALRLLRPTEPDAAGPPPRPLKSGLIAVIPAGDGDPFGPALRRGAEAYHQRLGSRQTRFAVPAGDRPEDQVALLESLAREDLRAVCIHPVDPAAVEPILRDLRQRGAIVVSILRPLPPGIAWGHVGPDDAAVGRALAAAAAEAFDEGDTVMVLHAGLEDPRLGPRWRAFQEALHLSHRFEIFADVDCRDDPARARTWVAERSLRFPRLTGWIAMDDWLIDPDGTIDAALPPSMSLLTPGGVPAHWPAIRAGRLPVAIGIDASRIGEETLRLCEAGLGGAANRGTLTVDLPVRPISARNLDDYIRDWERWSASPTHPRPGDPDIAPTGPALRE